MSNQDKYYVPDKSEIRIGLEVEHRIFVTGEWRKIVVRYDDSLFWFCEHIRKGNIRIKRLDADDIEAEGWLLVDDDTNARYKFEADDCKAFYLVLNGGGDVFIEQSKKKENYPRFNGTIRNRLELRELMRMIGIKKESK